MARNNYKFEKRKRELEKKKKKEEKRKKKLDRSDEGVVEEEGSDVITEAGDETDD